MVVCEINWGFPKDVQINDAFNLAVWSKVSLFGSADASKERLQ